MADEDAIAEMLAAAAGDNPMAISSKGKLEAEVEELEEEVDDEEVNMILQDKQMQTCYCVVC